MRCIDIFPKYKDKILEAIPRYLRQVPESGEAGVAVERNIGAYTQYPEATALLGRTFTETGLEFHKMFDLAIANTQLDKFQTAALTRYNQFQSDKANTPDYKQWRGMLDKTIEDINKYKEQVTHPLSRQQVNKWIAENTTTRTVNGQQLMGNWEKDLQIDTVDAITKNAIKVSEITHQKARDLLDPNLASDAWDRDVAIGICSKDEAAIGKPAEIEEINSKIRVDAALSEIQLSPQDTEEIISKFPGLTAKERTDLLREGRVLNNYRQSEEERVLREQQDEMHRKLTLDFLNGKLTLPILKEALENNWISLPFHDSLRNAMLDAEKPTYDVFADIKVLEAIKDDKLTTNQRLEVFAANLKGLDDATRKSRAVDIINAGDPSNPVNEPTNIDILSAITELENAGFLIGKDFKGETDRDIKIENLSRRIELHNSYMKWVKENPKATPKEKRLYFEEIVSAYKENAVKGWLSQWWEKYMSTEGEGVVHKRRRLEEEGKVKETKTEDIQLESAPDTRLDNYWDILSDMQKRDIWKYENDPDRMDAIVRMIQNAKP